MGDCRLYSTIARFGDPLIMVDLTTAPGTGCQTAKGSELTAIVEMAVEPFEPENRGDFRANAPELQQQLAG